MLKLFFNPEPADPGAAHPVGAQHAATRKREELDTLYYEVMHNLVSSSRGSASRCKNLKMRVESMSSRLDFDERRARALEGVVHVPARRAPSPLQPPAGAERRAPVRAGEADAGAAHAAAGAGGRRRRPGERRRGRGRTARRRRTGRPSERRRRRRRHVRRGATDGDSPPDGHAPRSREARGRRSALRRGHQRRRRAARALHRRAARAARRRRSPHDLRARLRHLAERAARRASSRSTASRCAGFPVARTSAMPRDFGRRSRARLRAARTRSPTSWPGSTAKGPASPALIDYLGARRRSTYFIFFSYRYYHAWHGARAGRRQGGARADRRARSGDRPGDLRAGVPRRPRAHVQLARRARDDPGASAATPTCPASSSASARMSRSAPTRRASGRSSASTRPFAIYIGRIDENKGCKELFDYFQRYAAMFPRGLDLVLVGSDGDADSEASAHPPSRVPRRRGQVRRAGRRGPADHAVVLREPVDGGARGVGARQAGARQRPLRRAQGAVHPQQRRAVLRDASRSSPRRCTRSSRTGRCTRVLGRNGREFFRRHYAWPVIERKYLDMLAAARARAGAAGRSSRCPGWFARRRKTVRPAGDVLADVPAGPVAALRRPRAMTAAHGAARPPGPRDARATATPSATKCSASSARCAAAGYESDDLRRDRRSAARGPDRSTTATWSAAITEQDVLIHHFSIGSRASRTAYALPGRMVLVYHNITPPEYFIGVHKDLVQLCFHGRRELTAYIDRAASWRSATRSSTAQELEALGFPPTGVLPVVPDFTHLDVPPDRALAGGVRRRVDQRAVRRPRDPEQAVRGRDPRRSTSTRRGTTRARGCCWSARTAASRRYLALLHALVARLGTPDVHFLGHVSNEELTALYDVADLFLCASEHEGFCVPLVEAFYKRVPVSRYAATAVPGDDGRRRRALRRPRIPAEVARRRWTRS